MASSSDAEVFDLVVIGAGPAGYVAAIRAAQLGMKTACIEKEKTLGGTCLNIGCIPSKALLDSSEHFHFAKSKFSKHGISVGDVQLDLGQMMKRKDGVVRQLTGGVDSLFKKNKITRVVGFGMITQAQGDVKTVEVKNSEGQTQTLNTKRILIATGSIPVELPFLKYDGKRIIHSTHALSLPEVPKHLVVIGGGVIGLELGSVWMRLGAKVTVIEFQNRILPGVEVDCSKELFKALVKQGMNFQLSTKCLGVRYTSDSEVVIEAEEIETKKKIELPCDWVLVAVGRKPYTDNLGIKEAGIAMDDKNRVVINKNFETNIKGVYAAGDVVDGPMLAHKSEEEGIAAVEIMAGQAGHVNYDAIPNVVYTWPEVASVGYDEAELKERGVQYKVGTFPFIANGRAKAMDEVEGLVKIISEVRTDRVLGVHIVGPRASEMIAEAVAYIEMGASAEDIARTCHAHPTLSEIVKEAALATDKRQIHL